ncbi:hypothetical protein SAMN05720764_101402 [Fibrobacter sp. UWH5]|uniref:hypothetical protein n=1 Tax=Fibrobacter sp. UWH5 TaxID=1896211 RepID=UPI0009106655|nr:hypothetical protein [Fibrobacter sp. UWH5]SHK42792.1 hypothetical protein SAMN05720764_101402 [Fibrobacter sp. UWH5]
MIEWLSNNINCGTIVSALVGAIIGAVVKHFVSLKTKKKEIELENENDKKKRKIAYLDELKHSAIAIGRELNDITLWFGLSDFQEKTKDFYDSIEEFKQTVLSAPSCVDGVEKNLLTKLIISLNRFAECSKIANVFLQNMNAFSKIPYEDPKFISMQPRHQRNIDGFDNCNKACEQLKSEIQSTVDEIWPEK